MDDLALLILAPQARVDDGVFAWDASPAAIRRKVRRRVEDYAGERDAWFRDWFEPTCRRRGGPLPQLGRDHRDDRIP